MIIKLLVLCSSVAYFSSLCECQSQFAGMQKAERQKDGSFQCGLQTAVAGVDLKGKGMAYCRSYLEWDKSRVPENCRWQKRCFYPKKDKLKEKKRPSGKYPKRLKLGIARGLRFVGKGQPSDLRKFELYCCIADCKAFSCEDKKMSSKFITKKDDNNTYINQVKPLRKKKYQAEFCKPICAAYPTVIALGSCNENGIACTSGSYCCSKRCDIYPGAGGSCNGVCALPGQPRGGEVCCSIAQAAICP